MKKKILFHSDFSLIKTGFAKNAKFILSYLYNTKKYDLVHCCMGKDDDPKNLQRTPWKSIGCISENTKNNILNKDHPDKQSIKTLAGYGVFDIDNVILQEKPDVYIGAQDIWAVDFTVKKPWFYKINSAIWTTLDSLPLLPTAIEVAKNSKNYWVWSDFARKEFEKIGIGHVKTVHGIVNCSNLYKQSPQEKQKIRKDNNINEDSFIVGFVFRNQPRKTIPSLLKGFKKFKTVCENSKLLLHTSFSEGWDIDKLRQELKIDNEDVLVTHFCSSCLQYEVKPFIKENKKCTKCNNENSLETVNIVNGVSETQLNDIYNLMNVYCHPFTSGGQEIPIQEAKLTELITLVTDYSCGEECCYPEAYSLPLKWNEYREMQTGFIKANTCPDSIFEQLKKVFEMSKTERDSMGLSARNWVKENFSPEKIGKFIEDFIDKECFEVSDSAFFEIEKKNPKAVIENVSEDLLWLRSLFKNVLKINLDHEDENGKNLKPWMEKLKNGISRRNIETYVKKVAIEEEIKNNKDKKAFDFFNFSDDRKRILYIVPNEKSDIYISSGFFKSIKQKHQNHDLYVASNEKDFGFFVFNDFVKGIFKKSGIETEEFFKENKKQRFFDIVYAPHLVNKFDFIFDIHE